MAYELNKDRYHDMDRNRTCNMISPINIEIPIERQDYHYFIADNYTFTKIRAFEDEVCSIYDDCELKERFRKKLNITLLPNFIEGQKADNYFLGYSPKSIIAAIYNILGIGTVYTVHLNRLNYDNPIDYYYYAAAVKGILKEHIAAFEQKQRDLEEELDGIRFDTDYTRIMLQLEPLKEKIKFAYMSLDKIDYIFSLYDDRRLSTLDERGIKWRELSYLLSINSLRIYKKTGKNDYLAYPFKFYAKCSKPDEDGKQMLYVSGIDIDDREAGIVRRFNHNFYEFNNEFERSVQNSPIIIEYLLGFKDNNFMEVFDTLNPDHIYLNHKNFGDFLKYKLRKTKTKKKKDPKGYEERQKIALRQLQSKIEFYSNPEFSDHIVYRLYDRTDNVTGYVLFLMRNGMVVADKFFIERLDGSCTPAMDAAVYAAPLDVYLRLGKNSGELRRYVRDNKGSKLVLHKYHTESDSYRDALLELTKRESVSLISSEDYIRNLGGTIEPKDIKRKTKKPSNKKDDKKE